MVYLNLKSYYSKEANFDAETMYFPSKIKYCRCVE